VFYFVIISVIWYNTPTTIHQPKDTYKVSNYSKEYLKHKTVIYPNEYGEVIEDSWVESKDKANIKSGWSRMYRNEYDNIILSLKSSKEIEVFINIRDSINPEDFSVTFNQVKLAKKLNTSRATVSLAVKRLVELDYLRKMEGVFYANPFVYIPNKRLLDNMQIKKIQDTWKDIEKKV
jgi:predicted transcriptional regulator